MYKKCKKANPMQYKNAFIKTSLKLDFAYLLVKLACIFWSLTNDNDNAKKGGGLFWWAKMI